MDRLAELLAEDKYARLDAEEEFVLLLHHEIITWMKEKGVEKAELARRLGVTRAHVSRLLSDNRNMTIRSFAAICWAIGVDVSLHRQPSVISSCVRKAPVYNISKKTQSTIVTPDFNPKSLPKYSDQSNCLDDENIKEAGA